MLHTAVTVKFYLLFLQQDVDGGQVFAVVVRLDLALETAQPLIEVGAALSEQLRLVGVEKTLSFGLGGGLQLRPHRVERRQLLLHHCLCLRLL